jgi:hypothetical protein
MDALTTEIVPDLREAERFLALMAEATPVTFQTFDDRKGGGDGSLAEISTGDLERSADHLARLNSRGAGIFWMVNQGNGHGRRTENVTGVRAVFVDLDGAPLEPVLRAPLEPHAIVESSPRRWHAYWLVEGCGLDQFRPAQLALAKRFNGDTAVNDLPRVMRLPGFIHRKAAPFRSRIVELRHNQPYGFMALVAALRLDLANGKPSAPEISALKSALAPVSEGQRRNYLLKWAAQLNWRGMPAEAVDAAVRAENDRVCSPPLSNEEITPLVQDVLRRYSDQHGRDLAEAPEALALEDFYAFMPSHSYIFIPTRELWPPSSVNGRIAALEIDGKKIAPAAWLDHNRPVGQMIWHPHHPEIVEDRVLDAAGWVEHIGTRVFNLYRPPNLAMGDPFKAGLWIDHVNRIYPEAAAHIVWWLAHRIQRPGEKINHALVLGGAQGIGKDTLLEPVKAGVGPWNWNDISPTQMLGRFNGWCKAVVVRINEARDLGEHDRFAFYDHSKGYIAAPPDVIRCDEKNLREHAVANVMGVIITTNHKTDGIYLPADDRRHFVAWSDAERGNFDVEYWNRLYGWYANGGIGHVVAYLNAVDLSGFDAKAPPPKTTAFWAIVQAGEAPESAELRDVIDALGSPPAFTIQQLIDAATGASMFDIANELRDRKNRRATPHRLERVGYVPVRNPDADDGLFKVVCRRQVVYAKRGMSTADQIRAARTIG